MDCEPRLLVGLTDPEIDGGLIRYAAMVTRLYGQAGRRRAKHPTSQGGSNGSNGMGSHDRAYHSVMGHTAAGSTVRYVQVLPPARATGGAADLQRLRQHLRCEVQACNSDNGNSAAVGCEVVRGTFAKSLLELAAEQQSDLILVGDQLGMARRPLAGNLAREAACSVWLVPEDAPAVISRILVPVDLSERAADSLRVAIALARKSRPATCLALHVYFNDALVSYPEYNLVLRQEKEQALEQFLARIDCQGVDVEPLVLEGAKVSHVISRVAEKQAVDLIVMATRGRTGPAAFLLGSVTEQMVVKARAPLLVVKHFGARMGLLQVLADRKWHRQNDLRFN